MHPHNGKGTNEMDDIVSTDWVFNALEAGNICVIDATRHHFAPERDAQAEYLRGHIPGAFFLDMDSFYDPSSPTENTIPSPEQFSERIGKLGIRPDEQIVIYDDSIVKTAARAWFIFTLYGFKTVAVLDGGLAKWVSEGKPLSAGAEIPRPVTRYVAIKENSRVRSKQDILTNIEEKSEIIVDGRGVNHFTGRDPDPNALVEPGHIPGSVNVPFWDLFGVDGTFRSTDELRELFHDRGVDLNKALITSCGSGVVACSLILAFRRVGKVDVALYDGSWTEWGSDHTTPKQIGSPQV